MKRPLRGRARATIALLLLALSPAIEAAGPASSSPRVVNVFEVGEHVYVRALAVEVARDALWVGTSAGVHEIDLRKMQPRNTFTRQHGLANEYVFAIGIDQHGYKWFGTNAGGASRYKDGKWKTYFPMHGLADYWVYAFANQGRNSLWIGTWAGANHFDLKTNKFKTYLKELINEWVYGIAVDKQGRVWFGTEGGVTMFDGKRWKSWTHDDGLGAPNTEALPPSSNTGLGTRSRHDLSTLVEGKASYNPNYVFSMHVAPDGSVYAGTWGGGLARFDGNRWSNFSAKDGLAGNIVYSIVQDKQGALWLGTNNGVSRFDGKNWKSLGRNEGLLDSHVYALAISPNGDVWAGTKRGVAHIRID